MNKRSYAQITFRNGSNITSVEGWFAQVNDDQQSFTGIAVQVNATYDPEMEDSIVIPFASVVSLKPLPAPRALNVNDLLKRGSIQAVPQDLYDRVTSVIKESGHDAIPDDD